MARLQEEAMMQLTIIFVMSKILKIIEIYYKRIFWVKFQTISATKKMKGMVKS